MKVKSSKPKGQRIFKSTHKHRPLWIEPVGRGYWFDCTIGEWTQDYDASHRNISSYYSMEHKGYKNVWSLKAALRLIRKWNLPKGTKISVSLPYVGYKFIVTK